VYYASLFDAKVLLGSATPSIETYYNTEKGKYALIELNERFGGILLPTIEIVDTRKVAQKGKSNVVPQLKEAIEKTIADHRQVILFKTGEDIHRILFAEPVVICRSVINCDVTLTLHKFSNKLHCHYCGTTYPKLVECPACGSVNWMEKNFGTEKIEEMLEAEFPNMKVARMDVDAVRGKNAHDS
jgi:primosomal protein N' (replication factor Y)